MKLLWKVGTRRGGMAQWALFGIAAVIIGLVVFVLAALGLVVGVALAGIFSLFAVLASRRRSDGASIRDAMRQPASGVRDNPEGDLVELDRNAYTVRIMDEKNAAR